ncbi:hypothetical protein Pan153_34960 [Gimesia panareensis]|uniref:Uncharacterized protein n=1 Tax=Gimesia panareensis TaxID=2527978 RepID=A0A518FRB4_9PLAN|nr:hypothetical protein [Gimesia panareensis]QDV18835.1 hypothetical protein Pan153_34960 [Gimesia panareensis]
MSDDNFYADDDQFKSEEFSAPPKKGMSGGVKVIIAILVLGGVGLLLCCGGVFYAFRNVKAKVTENKKEIIEIQNEITTITIPDSFVPQFGMSVNVIGKHILMAAYEEKEKQGALVLMSFGIPNDGMVDMNKEFRNNLKQQNQNQRELEITKQEQKEFTINGEKVEFTFAEGKDKNGKEFHQIMGVFPGKTGATFLFIQIASDKYNEEEIVEMIKSIK